MDADVVVVGGGGAGLAAAIQAKTTGAGVEFLGLLEEPPHRKPRMHNVLPSSRAYIYHLEE